jgi:hypothetical protein
MDFCSTSTGEAGKNAETGFMRWSPVCSYRGAKRKICIYIVNTIKGGWEIP